MSESRETRGRLRVIVRGRVQGVGYRYFALDAAVRVGARGWVRNLGRDAVEVLAEGQETALAQLLRALREGPLRARVADVQVERQPYRGDLGPFEVRASGYL